ncbi:MAG: DUF1302 domain-containing protein [Gammaproteobacteria bacterium]|nr:DUF1302 domain-containing protein [Gammaproteobacteria bacterium]
MTDKRGSHLLPLATMLLCLAAVDARAIEFAGASYDGSFDTTLSYGVRSRVEERDTRIIGIPNGGEAFSVNGDDGNLNFDEGIVSNTAKVTAELELNFDRWGAFTRGSAFYDYEIMKEERPHVKLTDPAKDLVGSDAEILDAYLWAGFDAGDNPGEVRFGNQVLSWGESTFIQNSINTINPVDVRRLRVPGAELREALVPIPLLSASLGVTENTTVEAFYQIQWEETVIDPPGSYFSTNDFAGDGGNRVQLGFGGVPEGDFLGVPRAANADAGNEGQFGLAYRLFVPSWRDTEFGLYYIRHHSRLPVISGITGTAQLAQDVYTAAGVVRGENALVDTLALAAYAPSANYFIEYPEDIDLLGVSFNTELGTTGVALQGEVSHRLDVPLQVDDVELLFAALGPISNTDDPAGTPGFAELNQLGRVVTDDTVIPGYIRRDVTQIQFTGTKLFSQVLGAELLTLVGEVGYNYVHDFPNKDELRLESPGTYLSGNENLSSAHGPGTGLFEPASAFADRDSWGYRLVTLLTYNNAIGAVNLKPRLAWAQDVSGNSPGPGGSFLEGRQALTLGLGADYQNRVTGDLSYTSFGGAGRYNLINDRDFVSFNVKYSF